MFVESHSNLPSNSLYDLISTILMFLVIVEVEHIDACKFHITIGKPYNKDRIMQVASCM